MGAVKYLLIGGGAASISAAESIRRLDSEGSVLLVGAETHYPYSRPPTSKQMLTDERMTADNLYFKRAAWYERNRVSHRLGVRAAQLNTDERLVHLDDGSEVRYERLLLALGTTLNRLGIPGDNLPNVHYLRTVDDALALREAAAASKRAVVVGNGFIALEAAAALSARGLSVTVVGSARHVWNRVLDSTVADWLEGQMAAHDVVFKRPRKASSFLPRGVQLDDGQFVECDLVVVGVGVRPALELVENTPLYASNGIETNEFLETAVAGVYAAGDVACYQDVVFQKKRRVEHFDVAIGHGRRAGANMAGEREAFDHLPFFFSQLYDLNFEFLGEFESGWDRVQIEGDMASKRFGAVYYLDSTPLAAMRVNLGGPPLHELDAVLRQAALSRV